MGTMMISAIVVNVAMATAIAVLGKLIIKKSNVICSLENDILILKRSHAIGLKRQKFDVSQQVRSAATNDIDALLDALERSELENEDEYEDEYEEDTYNYVTR